MLKNFPRETYAAGSVIFAEGELGTCAYIIEEGSVVVSVSSTQTAHIGKGELFGEIALLDKLPRTATVHALEETVLIPIKREVVSELLEKTDPVVRHLLLIILERYRSTRKQPAFDPSQTTVIRRDVTRGIATKHLILASDIVDALKDDQFEMFYQPICSLKSGSLVGFEALIRWHHPAQGMVSPMDFLGLAEQTGQIREIGLWTLQQACTDWPILRARTNHSHPFVSVNLSPSQLTGIGFVSEVADIVSQHQMPPAELKLELTETIIINNPTLALELLMQLTKSGSSLALDDFGTGHSSLEALHRYPIGTMKIDRSFISQMHTSKQSAKIVESSIELAHSLGLDVVAEGVETENERGALVELGCEFGQGWLFGKPASLRIF
jgi:EAL domain-containing protein (putative c-di-GMP-specific phosphodiesterase class I)